MFSKSQRSAMRRAIEAAPEADRPGVLASLAERWGEPESVILEAIDLRQDRPQAKAEGSEESDPGEAAISRLRSIQRRRNDAQAEADRLAKDFHDGIRQALQDGLDALSISNATGLTRTRIYQIRDRVNR